MSGLIINPYVFATGGGGDSLTGVVSFTNYTQGGSSGANAYGYEFTVGASDITVTGLRNFMPTARAETIRLFRVSDAALLASVEVTSATEEWVAGDLASTVTLSSGANYVVATRRTDGNVRAFYYTQAGETTFADDITWVQYRLGNTDSMPASKGTAQEVFGLADIVYEL